MIENKNRTAEEAKAIQVAEESRELDWKSKSFMGSMFMGDLDIELAYPFPEQSEEDRKAGDDVITSFESWARVNLDGDAIDKAQGLGVRFVGLLRAEEQLDLRLAEPARRQVQPRHKLGHPLPGVMWKGKNLDAAPRRADGKTRREGHQHLC